MELTEAMRTTGTCRYFRPDPVPDDVLRAAFDVARFGPQGGNRQPVRWIVVRDAATKQALADLYLPPWKAYLDGIGIGDVNVGALPRAVQDADHFAEHLASVPVLVVVCAELAGLHPQTPRIYEREGLLAPRAQPRDGTSADAGWPCRRKPVAYRPSWPRCGQAAGTAARREPAAGRRLS